VRQLKDELPVQEVTGVTLTRAWIKAVQSRSYRNGGAPWLSPLEPRVGTCLAGGLE
jgi:hypothetical protein